MIAQLTEVAVIPPAVEVALVHPVVGGSGSAHLDYNSIRIEAMMVNPLPELPEVVRMAWLMAQLQVDVPVNSETINKNRLPWIASLALLPVTLSAGQFVELVEVNERTLKASMDAWIRPAFPDIRFDSNQLQQSIWQWWMTYQDGTAPWPVALAALDRMLLV